MENVVVVTEADWRDYLDEATRGVRGGSGSARESTERRREEQEEGATAISPRPEDQSALEKGRGGRKPRRQGTHAGAVRRRDRAREGQGQATRPRGKARQGEGKAGKEQKNNGGAVQANASNLDNKFQRGDEDSAGAANERGVLEEFITQSATIHTPRLHFSKLTLFNFLNFN